MMWVRSQTRWLIQKISNIALSVNNISCKWHVITDIDDEVCILGEYNSEAEALKVLDLMVTQHDMDVYEHGPEGMRVFQMPPKGFSKAGGE